MPPEGNVFVVLVDTSVWIAVFRRRNPLDLEATVEFDEIVTCLPVYQEVLQGFDDESSFRHARDAMASLPMLESPLRREVFDEAAGIFRMCRRSGITVRSGVDCLIAACALRNAIPVLHIDRDFDLISRVVPLESRRAV